MNPSSTPTGRETILLVDDEAPLRMILQLTLEHFGYRVLAADSGAAALELWRTHQTEVALLLTDLNLTERMNGAQLGERLRADQPDLRIIYTSGAKAAAAAQGLTLVPGVNFLSKPFESATLAAAVRAMLDAPG